MKYRLLKYNASLSQTPLWKWKLQLKRGGKFYDYRIYGAAKTFDHPKHGENYIALLILKQQTL